MVMELPSDSNHHGASWREVNVDMAIDGYKLVGLAGWSLSQISNTVHALHMNEDESVFVGVSAKTSSALPDDSAMTLYGLYTKL